MTLKKRELRTSSIEIFKRRNFLFLAAGTALILNGCGEKLPEVKLDIKRYELIIKELSGNGKRISKSAIAAAYKKDFKPDWKLLAAWNYSLPPDYLDSLETKKQLPLFDSTFTVGLTTMCEDKHHQLLIDSILKYYPANYDLSRALTPPMRRLKKHIPNFEPPKIRTIQIGYTPRMEWYLQYEHDALYLLAERDDKNKSALPQPRYMGIALEYFCGPKFPYLHPEIPRYLRARFKPEDLPVSVMLKFCDLYLPPLQEFKLPTLVDRIVWLGVKTYFLDVTLPDAPDSLKLFYTASQMKWISENERRVYNELIPHFYSKGTDKIAKYVEEGPFTSVISPEAPPRIGQFVGLQIVRKYIERHPETTLLQLLQTTNYDKIFKEAGYKP